MLYGKSISSYRKYSYWFNFVFLALHIFIASRLPLSGDEAHYALYGKWIDWSYFDHPPLIGWLNAFILWALGDSELALRIIPSLLIFFGAEFSFRISQNLAQDKSINLKHIKPDRSGFRAMLIYYSLVFIHLLSVGLLPDTFLIFGIFLLYFGWIRLLKADSKIWWLFIGFIIGLLGLAKYTSILFVFSLAILLLKEKKIRLILHPYFFLAVILAISLQFPTLWWNHQNNWISFEYQLERGLGNTDYNYVSLLIFNLALFLIYNPLNYVLTILFLVLLFQNKLNYKENALLLLSIPILLFFIFSSGKGKSLPHWPISGFMLIIPLSANYIENYISTNTKLKYCNLLALGWSYILVIFLFVSVSWIDLPYPNSFHPIRDMIGWKESIIKLNHIINNKLKYNQRQREKLIFVNNWSYASRTAWYSYPTPVKVLDKRTDQFTIWFGNIEENDSGYLILPWYHDKNIREIRNNFHKCDYVDKYIKTLKNFSGEIRFDFYYCERWKEL